MAKAPIELATDPTETPKLPVVAPVKKAPKAVNKVKINVKTGQPFEMGPHLKVKHDVMPSGSRRRTH